MSRPLVSVAPMMALTDRHFRYLARLLAPGVLLYSEMITAKAILHGDRDHLLGKDAGEGDVVLQLGGDDPEELARAAAIGESYGYVEINLNVGCPSERVAKGNFGACLMADPKLVGRGLAAMKAATSVPVSVKHRIGIDDADAFSDLRTFVDIVDEESAGVVSAYTVHARKAWLQGLSPKENRSVPPLRYEDVWRLKAERPELVIEVNGGIASLSEVQRQLEHVDGVMLGRAVYEDPTLLVRLSSGLSLGGSADSVPGGAGALQKLSRGAVVERMVAYTQAQLANGAQLGSITRHLLNLYKGVPGARSWRRTLTEGAPRPAAGAELLREALAQVPEHVSNAPLADGGGDRSAASVGMTAGASVAEGAQVLAGDDQMLDLVGAFTDTR